MRRQNYKKLKITKGMEILFVESMDEVPKGSAKNGDRWQKEEKVYETGVISGAWETAVGTIDVVL